MQELPAQLTIARNRGNDIGIREVLIYLDGTLLTVLLNRQSFSHPLAPGPHTLRAYNTLVSKTITFDAQPGEQLRFAVSNRAGCGTSLIFLLGAGPIYLSLERVEDPAQP